MIFNKYSLLYYNSNIKKYIIKLIVIYIKDLLFFPDSSIKVFIIYIYILLYYN